MAAATFALISLWALTAVYAYDFKDANYNEVLTDELDDAIAHLYKRSVHPRVRREEPGDEDKCHHHMMNFLSRNQCCGQDIVKKFHMKNRDAKRQCFKEVMEKDGDEPPKDGFSCEHMEKRKQSVICALECFGKKMDLLDDEGNIKEEDFKKFITESELSEAEWFKEKQDDVVAKCVAEADEAKSKSAEGSCNPSGAVISHCIYREFQLSCPESEIKDKEVCEKFKQRIENKKMSLLSSKSSED